MKKKVSILLLIVILLTSCMSFKGQKKAPVEQRSMEAEISIFVEDVGDLEQEIAQEVSLESLDDIKVVKSEEIEFLLFEDVGKFEDAVVVEVVKGAPVQTAHEGSLKDPVPLREIKEKSVYQKTDTFFKNNYFDVFLNVNYSVRGEGAMLLYENYLRQNGLEKYTPKSGFEIMIVNVSVGIGQRKSDVMTINPTHFNVATRSGVKLAKGRSDSDEELFSYDDILDFELKPGEKRAGNLVYEVPIGQEILLGFVDTWFET